MSSAATGPTAAPATGQVEADASGITRFQGRAMGSALRLSVPSRVPPTSAEAAWTSVVREFEAAEQAMSRFRDSSDVTRANRARDWVVVDARLRRALVAADRARRMTGGLYDARVIGDLERLGYQGASVSAHGERARRSERHEDGDPRTLLIRRDGRIRLPVPVDLGGIGKGLALRWAADRALWHLPDGSGFLLEAGGDIRLGGPGPASGWWLVAIEDPGGADGPAAVLAIADGAVATSSIWINRWSDPDGRPVHHLLDPRTGEPGGAGLRSVTVAGVDPAWCEVRTKQLFLAGSGGIRQLATRLDLAAWWFGEDDRLSMTPAARQMTRWVATEAGLGA